MGLISFTRVVYGEPGSSSSPGQPGTYTSLNLNDAVNQIVLDADAAVNKLTLTMAALTAARTWTLPNASDTFVGKATADTLTNKTLTAPALTSPVITTGTVAADPVVALGIASKQYADTYKPTMVLKTGSGAGNYTEATGSYVDVDGTNLAYTVTPAVGQRVLINVSLTQSVSAGNDGSIALTDGTTVLTEHGASGLVGTPDRSLTYVFIGDGASHTFKLRFKRSSGTQTIVNTSSTLTPMMTFWLGTSN